MTDYNKNLYTGITAMHSSLPITIYKRNYFLPVLLTKVNQITYLVDRFLSELFLTQRELEKVFASCSMNVQLVNKFNTVGVKQ